MLVKKPMMPVEQLIDHMKAKGIKFSIINEADAKIHLDKHNNYFKLTSYRKNYTKVTSGVNVGKYEDLDFAYLIELARIDTEIRHLLLKMALDIEHFLKVALIKAVENRMISNGDEDGYEIIKGYLIADDISSIPEKEKCQTRRNKQLSEKINQSQRNPYCKGLVEKYSDEMPIWAFVELTSFGDIKELIEYYSTKTGWRPSVDFKTLDRIRQLRNACAHGNCIINDLYPVKKSNSSKKGVSFAPLYISKFVTNAGINKNARSKKLSNPRINQIVHLLYAYNLIITSHNTRTTRLTELHNLINVRLVKNKSYFFTNQLLTSTYDFFKKIDSNLFKTLDN